MSNNANVQQTKAQVNDAANKAANKAEKAVKYVSVAYSMEQFF